MVDPSNVGYHPDHGTSSGLDWLMDRPSGWHPWWLLTTAILVSTLSGCVEMAESQSTDSAPPAPTTINRLVPGEPFAVWPYDDPVRDAEAFVSGENAAVRTDPSALTTEFVRSVLGWENPGVALIDPQSEEFKVFRVRPTEGGGEVIVHVSTPVQPDWWSVRWVQASEDSTDPSFSFAQGLLQVGFSAGTFEYADVTFHSGAIEETSRVTASSAVLAISGQPDTPGHVLIVARDADGKALTAVAFATAAGTSAAG